MGDAVGERRIAIFNADDFGLTAGTNAGIIGTFRRGLVRSASLMATTPGFDDAVALARAHPDLDLGIHLALTGVRPLLAPARVPSLVDDSGRFPTLNAWLVRAFLRRLNPAEIHQELRAQVLRALETGLPFSHIDGHHHTHLFEPVARVVGELAREFGIPIVRRVANRRAVVARLLREGRGEPGLFSPKSRFLAAADARWGDAFAGLARTDGFRGFAFPTDLDGWDALARSCPEGVTEIMCHPGVHDPEVGALDGYIAGREVELRWLCDPRVAAIFASHGVEPGSFAHVAGTKRAALRVR